jgi:hypothetical protein
LSAKPKRSVLSDTAGAIALPAFVSMTDDEARKALETILRLRRSAQLHKQIAISILPRVSALAAGIGGDAAANLLGTVSATEYGALPVEWKRGLIASSLQGPLLQPGAADDLNDALRALNGGQVNSILQPSQTRRRGSKPSDVRSIELHILCWIEWRRGQGASKAKAIADLKVTIGTDEKSLDKNLKKLRSEFPIGHVDWVLEQSRKIGEMEVQTQPWPDDAMERGRLQNENRKLKTLSLDRLRDMLTKAKSPPT